MDTVSYGLYMSSYIRLQAEPRLLKSFLAFWRRQLPLLELVEAKFGGRWSPWPLKSDYGQLLLVRHRLIRRRLYERRIIASLIISLPEGPGRSIAVCLSVCLSVCPFAYLKSIFQTPRLGRVHGMSCRSIYVTLHYR